MSDPPFPRLDTRAFVLDKFTANHYRYRAVAADGMPVPLEFVYVERWWLGMEPPQQIVVTMEAKQGPKGGNGGLEPEAF